MEKNKRPQALRTFKADTTETIRKGQVSLSNVYLKQQLEKTSSPLGKKRNFINLKTVLTILLILAFASAGGYLVYLLKERLQTAPGAIEQKPPKAIIPSQKEKVLKTKNKIDFSKQLEQVLAVAYDAGEIIYLPISTDLEGSTQFLNSKSFLNLIEAKAPVLLTAFLEDSFFLGVTNLEKNHPVLIFKIKQDKYESAFAGMLKWENYILEDLNFIITEKGKLSTSSTQKFKDEIIDNQNIRSITTGESDEPIFLYSLFNKRYLIITDSVKSFKEVLRQFVLYKIS